MKTNFFFIKKPYLQNNVSFFIKKKIQNTKHKTQKCTIPVLRTVKGWLYNRFDFVCGIFQYYVFLASHGKNTKYIIHEIQGIFSIIGIDDIVEKSQWHVFQETANIFLGE